MRTLACLAFTAAFCGVLPAAEMADNPEYAYWSGYKQGTWVKLKVVNEMNGQTSVSEITSNLVEVSEEKVVLETTSVLEMNNQKINTPAQTREVPAKVEKSDPALKQTQAKAGGKEGSEQLTVSGQVLECKTYEVEFNRPEGKGTTKSWICEKIPGHVVKTETRSPAFNSTMELVGFEAK